MTDAKKALTADHAQLSDEFATRRYFSKFDAITGHLAKVAAAMEVEGSLTKPEVTILGRYIRGLANAFAALGNKYLLTGREGTPFGKLDFDRSESGFPVFQEMLTMAVDAQQAERHLRGMPSAAELKDDMIRQIVGELTIPTKLQYAMAQRFYYEALTEGDIFWARNDPEALWQRSEGERRVFLIHWAIFDSQVNLPVIYLMECEDSGRTSLPKDERRWPSAQAHLMAQSFSGLKLLTIAQGFDQDFDDLHPKRIRRFHVGPMYSSAYTVQSGPLCEVLAEAKAPQGQDWALAWTEEELVSERVRTEKAGWFSSVEREIFTLDPFSGRGADTGATRTERSIIMPERPYQVLAEKNPPGFSGVRKFVVSPGGRVFSYR
ncbi:hypothetical protein FHY55_17480 [Oceanicola sp. D3]|uniref:hypothetical protein n=1 Tax=Oceanicola sp. D3 TaxID=2587163 RepID=UPI00111E9E93|nr:hypothetical protein [Oceanicola sp. D3]QDC10916.1 hypothetical protein FHY55_17480 [Oceanicola sp. D3]